MLHALICRFIIIKLYECILVLSHSCIYIYMVHGVRVYVRAGVTPNLYIYVYV